MQIGIKQLGSWHWHEPASASGWIDGAGNGGYCSIHSLNRTIPYLFYVFIPTSISSLHNNKPVYRLQQQSIRRLAFVPPYSVFALSAFAVGGLSIERNQKPLAPEITLAVTHHDRQKQVEMKRSSRVNPHEIRLFSGCPYAVVKQGTKNLQKKISPTRVSVGSEPIWAL